MKTLTPLPVVVAFLVCILSAQPTGARTWYILPDGTGDASTVQAGIDSAAVGDIVEVVCGTYYEYDIVMKSGITLRSETGLADCVTIDAQGLGRVFYCEDVENTTSIEGFTVTNGNGSMFSGGGMYCENSSPSISHCNFIGNVVAGLGGGGGGMCCRDSSSPTLTHCNFSDNVADVVFGGGGGMYCNNSSPTLTHCSFFNNSVPHSAAGDEAGGGGLYFSSYSSPTLTYCMFSGNYSAYSGGGIHCGQYYNNNSPLNLISCTISGNNAGGPGGGIYCTPHPTHALTNSTITGNSGFRGGGIFVNGDLFAFNTDIQDNSATQSGSDGYVLNVSTALLTCCDVDLGQWFVEEGGTLILDNEGCGVAVEAKTWGDVKALYRSR